MSAPEMVVVIGASGFGRECLDVLVAMATAGAEIQISGVLDDNPSLANIQRLADREVAYLGALDDWVAKPALHARYVLGIGNPRVRRTLADKLDSAGMRPFTAVHPSSTKGFGSVFGDGVVVCAGATISTNVKLDRHVHVNPNATIGHDSVLHEFVSVNPAAVISGEVVILEGALVGAAATILQGLSIGERSVIAAGAVVTRDVPPAVVVKGVPGTWA